MYAVMYSEDEIRHLSEALEEKVDDKFQTFGLRAAMNTYGSGYSEEIVNDMLGTIEDRFIYREEKSDIQNHVWVKNYDSFGFSEVESMLNPPYHPPEEEGLFRRFLPNGFFSD